MMRVSHKNGWLQGIQSKCHATKHFNPFVFSLISFVIHFGYMVPYVTEPSTISEI